MTEKWRVQSQTPLPSKLNFNKNAVTLRYRVWVSAKRKTSKQANNSKTQTNTNRVKTNFAAQDLCPGIKQTN